MGARYSALVAAFLWGRDPPAGAVALALMWWLFLTWAVSRVRLRTGCGTGEARGLPAFLDPVELVLEGLPAGRDRDLAAGLLDKGSCDVLLVFQGDEGARIVEADQGVEDVLHRLQLVGGPGHVPPSEILEREPPELADRVPQPQELRGAKVPRDAIPPRRTLTLFGFVGRVFARPSVRSTPGSRCRGARTRPLAQTSAPPRRPTRPPGGTSQLQQPRGPAKWS